MRNGTQRLLLQKTGRCAPSPTPDLHAGQRARTTGSTRLYGLTGDMNMARIIGGLAVSHTPTIGYAVDHDKQEEAAWAPIFESFKPIKLWLQEKQPDVLFYIFNDHITSFFFDHYSAFALGVDDHYEVADEGEENVICPPLAVTRRCLGISATASWRTSSTCRFSAINRSIMACSHRCRRLCLSRTDGLWRWFRFRSGCCSSRFPAPNAATTLKSIAPCHRELSRGYRRCHRRHRRRFPSGPRRTMRFQ